MPKINLKDNVWIEGFNISDWNEETDLNDLITSLNHRKLPILYLGKTSEIPEEILKQFTSEVEFYPDEGCPLCLGYMIGDDDGKSTLYTSRIDTITKKILEEYCIIYKIN